MTRVKPARLIAALALLILGVVEFELAVNTTGGQIVDQQLMVGAATSERLSVFSAEFIGLVTPILIVGGVLVALMITLRNNPIALALRVVVVTLGPITTAWVLKQSLDRPEPERSGDAQFLPQRHFDGHSCSGLRDRDRHALEGGGRSLRSTVR